MVRTWLPLQLCKLRGRAWALWWDILIAHKQFPPPQPRSHAGPQLEANPEALSQLWLQLILQSRMHTQERKEGSGSVLLVRRLDDRILGKGQHEHCKIHGVARFQIVMVLNLLENILGE